MINLLPDIDKKKLEKTYYVRLGVVVLATFTVLTVVHSILLLPSYILLSSRVAAQTVEKTLLQKRLVGSSDTEITQKIAAIEKNISLLREPQLSLSMVDITTMLLRVPHRGVSITSISYMPKDSPPVKVRGVAATREDLQGYVSALEAQKGIEKVTFPISNLAKEQQLPFVLSITLHEK